MTVLYTWYSHFKYQVMLHDSTNALTIFCGYINIILAKKLDVFVIVYLDNIPNYINEMDLVNAIWWVFNQFWKYCLYTSLKKYFYYRIKIQFLGYMIFYKAFAWRMIKLRPYMTGFTPVSMRYLALSGICQLPLAIHLRY